MNRINVIVGRIGRPHGVRGELTVEPRTDEPDSRFAAGQTLLAEQGSWQITGSRWHSGKLLVRLDGVNDRNDAEALRGTVVSADIDETEQPAEEDEFYDRHLVGLSVRVGSQTVGRVSNVLHGAQDLLEIRTDDGLRMVPFVAALVPLVDLEAGYCEVVDQPGLLQGDSDE